MQPEQPQPPSSAAAAAISPEQPLLRPDPPPRRQNCLAALLGRATGRRGASAVVRDMAASQLEERRADWGYSRPVVVVDIVWNLAFAVAAAAVLGSSWKERPNVPVRAWIGVYGVQCVVHVVLVWVEYRRRNEGWRGGGSGGGVLDFGGNEREEREERSCRSDFAKRCESFNTMASFVCWVVGFYWVVYGGETLLLNAPKLYWLTVVFLAFDVFFAIFCVVLACVIGVALCCCLPCIIAILYAIAGQEGASDADISILPRYKYEESSGKDQKMSAGSGTMIPLGNSNGDVMTNERTLPHEDAECCICLTSYEDGAELHALPCNHHFHSACIVKWLRINATCPLCKYNILKGSEQV